MQKYLLFLLRIIRSAFTTYMPFNDEYLTAQWLLYVSLGAKKLAFVFLAYSQIMFLMEEKHVSIIVHRNQQLQCTVMAQSHIACRHAKGSECIFPCDLQSADVSDSHVPFHPQTMPFLTGQVSTEHFNIRSGKHIMSQAMISVQTKPAYNIV